ncbi:MAG: hypothetical protein ACI9K3_001070, partial [Halovenus sp.]
RSARHSATFSPARAAVPTVRDRRAGRRSVLTVATSAAVLARVFTPRGGTVVALTLTLGRTAVVSQVGAHGPVARERRREHV